MALTTALGKYSKQGHLNIPTTAANLSHKKGELSTTFRGHPGPSIVTQLTLVSGGAHIAQNSTQKSQQ